jgi:hypothetical protein
VSNCFSTSPQAKALVEQSTFLQQAVARLAVQRDLQRSAMPSASKRGGGEEFEAIQWRVSEGSEYRPPFLARAGDLYTELVGFFPHESQSIIFPGKVKRRTPK